MNLRVDNRVVFKLKRHPLALWGMAILGVLYTGMMFAEFIAPYSIDNGDRAHPYMPPSRIHFIHSGHFSLRPFVYTYSYSFNQFYERVFVENRTQPYYLSLFAQGDKVHWWGIFPVNVHLFGVEKNPANCRLYLLGADRVGRDLFSRIVYGSRVSLTIGLMGVMFTFAIGFLIGGLSGYYGGSFDWVTMRLAECFMLVPSFFLMLALRSAFPMNLSSSSIYLLIVTIMSLIGWAELARVVRGMALSIRKRDFVTAVRALGASDFRIITRHVLPQTISYAVVSLTLAIPGYILGESALSLIGLGIQDPAASWGNLLGDAMNVADIQYHPWILVPGFFIFITVMAFNFVGDGLRDALDPNR